MTFLPVSLNITEKRLLIIGGGKVAAHKMEILSRFTNNITVLAPEICDEIRESDFIVIKKKYHLSFLKGYHLVYACTNDHQLNKKIKQEANQLGILVNVADNPELCDFVSPAIYKDNELTVAVGSNATNVYQSIKIRDSIKDFLENNFYLTGRKISRNEKYPCPERNQQNPEQKDIISEGSGKVALVGFGPGNPELLTLKAKSCLESADIIFFDALLDSDYLQQFPALKVPVGKRCGKHSRPQEEINDLMLQAALSGKNVVRLKGGDPMVFGRAGEEIFFLKQHHIEVEVVSGVTSALAAAAQFRLPLTQRAVSSSVAFCHGHHINQNSFPMADTLVFFMGANHQQEIARKLISEGRPSETPVALISDASYDYAKSCFTTLEQLARQKQLIDTPLLILVGESIRNSLQNSSVK